MKAALKRFRIIMTENGISPRLDPEGEWLRYRDAGEVIEAAANLIASDTAANWNALREAVEKVGGRDDG